MVAVVHYYSLRELKLGTKPQFNYPMNRCTVLMSNRNILGMFWGWDFVPTQCILNRFINLSYIRKVEWIRNPCLGGHGHELTSINVWVLRETFYVLHHT